MEVEVLLAVKDRAEELGGVTDIAAIPIAWKAGTIENTGARGRPPRAGGDRVVGGRGVGGDPVALDREVTGSPELADRIGLERGVPPVWSRDSSPFQLVVPRREGNKQNGRSVSFP